MWLSPNLAEGVASKASSLGGASPSMSTNFMPYKDPKNHSAYNVARMKKRRDDWLRANGPCAVCGSSKDMEVDHIDPSTKVSHRIWNWCDSKRNEELKKCQALCIDCHIIKGYLSKVLKVIHGSNAAYKRGCRCEPCVLSRVEMHKSQRNESRKIDYKPRIAMRKTGAILLPYEILEVEPNYFISNDLIKKYKMVSVV